MDERPPRRRAWLWTGLAVVLLAGAAAYEWPTVKPWAMEHAGPVLALAGVKSEPAKQASTAQTAPAGQKAPAPVPVAVATAKTGDYPVVLTGLGTADAYNSVLVRSRVDGQIIKLNFKEGDLVNAGDVLVEIDHRPYQAALEQAQAKKQQDEANLANARRDLTRYESLAKSDFATRQQLDTQTAQVAQLTAQIAADQAAIDNAQTQLDYTTITAPIKGRVGFRLVDLGNIVNASSTSGIVEINQIKPIAVIYTQPEDTLPQISAGLAKGPLPVTALTTDGTQVLAQGELEVFNNQVDAASGTIRLKARFPNADKKLWPGLSVSTRMTVSTRQNVVLVPANAVQRGQVGFYAYVVGPDNKVEQRNLKITLMDQSQAVIDDGIKSGETVVTAGQYRLAPGVKVRATNETEKTVAAED
jgi:membrane fusion protein, multidrug efflux system